MRQLHVPNFLEAYSVALNYIRSDWGLALDIHENVDVAHECARINLKKHMIEVKVKDIVYCSIYF